MRTFSIIALIKQWWQYKCLNSSNQPFLENCSFQSGLYFALGEGNFLGMTEQTFKNSPLYREILSSGWRLLLCYQ